MDLQPAHWLVVASGGDLRASPNGGNLKSIAWRELEVVMLKTHFVDTPASAAAFTGHTVSLASISSMFRRAVAGGLSFQPLKSCKIALAALARVAGPLAQASPAAWTIGLAELQILPPHSGAPPRRQSTRRRRNGRRPSASPRLSRRRVRRGHRPAPRPSHIRWPRPRPPHPPPSLQPRAPSLQPSRGRQRLLFGGEVPLPMGFVFVVGF